MLLVFDLILTGNNPLDLYLFYLMFPRLQRSTLFPYTTLFRSVSFVAAGAEDAGRRDVAEHVVGVAGDPDDPPRGGVAALDRVGVVDDRLAAEGDEQQGVTQAGDVQRTRVTRGERLAAVEAGQQVLGL